MLLTVWCCGLFPPIPIDVPYRPLNFVSHGVFHGIRPIGSQHFAGLAGLPTELQAAQGRVTGNRLMKRYWWRDWLC